MSNPHWALSLALTPPLHLWSGEGDIVLDSQAYNGTGTFAGVTHHGTLGDPRAPARAQIQLRVSDATLREDLILETDPVAATVEWIYSPDGITFLSTGYKIVGFLSGPAIADGIYTASIDTYSHEVRRRTRIQYWSGPTQRQRASGDASMDAMIQFGQGIEIAWP